MNRYSLSKLYVHTAICLHFISPTGEHLNHEILSSFLELTLMADILLAAPNVYFG